MDFQTLGETDVVSVTGGQKNFIGSQTFVAQDLLHKVRASASQVLPQLSTEMTCKVLKPGIGWQSGTVRITLEFRPNEQQ